MAVQLPIDVSRYIITPAPVPHEIFVAMYGLIQHQQHIIDECKRKLTRKGGVNRIVKTCCTTEPARYQRERRARLKAEASATAQIKAQPQPMPESVAVS